MLLIRMAVSLGTLSPKLSCVDRLSAWTVMFTIIPPGIRESFMHIIYYGAMVCPWFVFCRLVSILKNMGKHKDQSQLLAERKAAEEKITIGADYWHHKDPNKRYRVIDLGFLESNDQIHVIYQAQYGGGIVFLRPVDSWLQEVEWEGETMPRFVQVTERG